MQGWNPKQIIHYAPELVLTCGLAALGGWLYTLLPTFPLFLGVMLAMTLLTALVYLTGYRRLRPYRKILQQAGDSLDQCAKGEVPQTLPEPDSSADPLTPFTRRLNEAMQQLSTLSLTSAEFAAKVDEYTRSLSDTAREILAQMDQQQDITQQAHEQVERLQTVFTKATEAAGQAVELASQSESEGNSGKVVMTEALSGMAMLADAVNDTGDIITTLGKDSEAIGGIVSVIRGVAEQTNLLALNAAIEAARAGEQGRGFAVVADEVRSLASKTHESTQEIQHIVERLLGHVDKAGQVIGNSVELATQTDELVENMVMSYSELVGYMASVSTLGSELAAATQGETQTASDARGQLQQIIAIADETAQRVAEMRDAGTALGETTAAKRIQARP